MTLDPRKIPFRRERLLALGVLAFLAPVPLVFSYAIEPVWMTGYLAVAGAFVLAVALGRIPCLGSVTLNLAGLAYAFVFYADLRFGSRRLLVATLHLLLFTTLVKLASIRRERDLAVALGLVGFLFLASIATSIHSSIFLFLAVFLAVAWPVLVRWGLFRDLGDAEEEWRRDPDARSLPGLVPTALSVVGTLLVAAPLFLTLPRLKAPLVKGFEEGREISTGFSESVDPDLFGILKRSDKVYLRVSADEPITRLSLSALRLRTLAFAEWDGRTWKRPAPTGERTMAPLGEPIGLPGVPPRATSRARSLSIDLLPLESRFVPYPVGSPGFRFPEEVFRNSQVAALEFDAGRNALLPFAPDRTIRYDALAGSYPDLAPPPPHDPSREEPGMPRVKEWALAAVGGADPARDPAAAAAAIERVLSTTFRYSLEIPRAGKHPTEEFLFERKTGHCETFATAMALALRELGIPSRFVTGFAGGELGFLGRYLIVRGHDAHSWVEAWCGPDRGWLSFDPTPPAGRPGVVSVPLSQRLRQIGDGIELLYDRYVLSFGQGDQMELINRVRERTVGAVAKVKGAVSKLQQAGPLFRRNGPGLLLVILLLLVSLLLARNVRRWREEGRRWGGRLPPETAAYRRLQRILRRRGAPLTPASSPAETLAAARERGAEGPAREIVRIYLAASFGGIPPGADVEARLAARLKDVKVRLAQAEKRAA